MTIKQTRFISLTDCQISLAVSPFGGGSLIQFIVGLIVGAGIMFVVIVIGLAMDEENEEDDE